MRVAHPTRPPETQPALSLPLQRALIRCTRQLDPMLANLLANEPRSRAAILQSIDPYGLELSSMKETCTALKAGAASSEEPRLRARAAEALNRGCAFVQ